MFLDKRFEAMLAESVSLRNELRPMRTIAVAIQQSVGGEAEAIPALHDFFQIIAIQRVQSHQITDRRRRVHHHLRGTEEDCG